MTTLASALRRGFLRTWRGGVAYALVVCALGTTIGAAICATAFVRLVVAQPLSYPEQDRLVVVELVTLDQSARVQDREFSFPAVMAARDVAPGIFASAVAIDTGRDVIRSHPAQPLVTVTYATPEYADLFAPPMALGRFPRPRDGDGSDRPVAVLSHAGWQSLFDGHPDVLGASVRTASGIDFEVVGVTAAGFAEPEFNGPGERTAVWLPWRFDPALQYWGWSATADSLTFAARLEPGVDSASAAARLSVLLDARWRDAVDAAAGSRAGWSTRVELQSAQRAIAGPALRAGPLLLAATAGLALIALFNVVHVLVARVAGRAREFAIQLALGATQAHLFRAVLADVLLLLVSAGAVALFVAAMGIGVMRRNLGGMLPRLDELELGWEVAAASLAAILALAPIVAALALAPIRRLVATVGTLAGRHGTAPRVSRGLRAALMTTQVGVAALTVAASCGVFRDAYGELHERGISLANSANVFLYQTGSPALEGPALEAALGQLRRKLGELPAVSRVSQAHSPLQPFIKSSILSTRSGVPFPVEVKRIDDEFFGLTGQAVATGRDFALADIESAAPVAIVNRALADLLEREGGALGAPLVRAGEPARTVVGVVDELAYPGASGATPRVYFPASRAGTSFNLEFRPGPRPSRQELVDFVAQVNPGLGVFLYDDLEEQRSDLLVSRRIAAIAAMLVALLVIVVSGIGLYGMLSYAIGLVRAEIGARLAFGARPRHIVEMLCRSHLPAIALGSIAGAVIALFGFASTGYVPLALTWRDAAASIAALVALALLACWLSARPMLAQSPADALREAGR